MSPAEIQVEVRALLHVMGCATVETLARDGRLSRSTVTAALKTFAYPRVIGGQKAIAFDPCHSGRSPAIPRDTQWSLKPWTTASGSLPLVVRPLEVQP
jgi:hypothetical protein